MRSERPLYWGSASHQNNPHREWKILGEIFHETEVIIHGVLNVDLDQLLVTTKYANGSGYKGKLM